MGPGPPVISSDVAPDDVEPAGNGTAGSSTAGPVANPKQVKGGRRRWPRRTIIGVSILVVLALILGGATWFYLGYKLGQIPRVTVKHLVKEKPNGAPINILLVGSDSRSFVGNNKKLQQQVGNPAVQTGQRSDVIILVRIAPKTKGIEMLSIPRDTWVPIAGTGGSNRINAAFNNGPERPRRRRSSRTFTSPSTTLWKRTSPASPAW